MHQQYVTARQAWQDRTTAPLRWLLIGDSITEGTATSNIQNTWPMVASRALRGTDEPNPPGYLPVANMSSRQLPWAISGPQAFTTHGLRRDHCLYMNDAADKITGTITGTHVRIWYLSGTTTTSPVIRIDGVQQLPVPLPSANPAVTSSWATYDLGESGPHLLEIAKGSGPCYIEGIEVFDGNHCAGLQVLNAARSGWSTVQFAATSGTTADGRALGNGAAWRTAIGKANPHLVTIMLGMNDFTTVVPPDTYFTNLETIVDWIRGAADVWPSIVLMMPPKRYTVGLIGRLPWTRYEYGLEVLAHRLGCGYLDLRQHIPDADMSGTGLFAPDGIHPNTAGHAAIGGVVSDWLLQEVFGESVSTGSGDPLDAVPS